MSYTLSTVAKLIAESEPTEDWPAPRKRRKVKVPPGERDSIDVGGDSSQPPKSAGKR